MKNILFCLGLILLFATNCFADSFDSDQVKIEGHTCFIVSDAKQGKKQTLGVTLIGRDSSWGWSCTDSGSNLKYTFYSCSGAKYKGHILLDEKIKYLSPFTFEYGHLGSSYGICEEFMKRRD
ncbi:hypothetical protein [Desulfovibrio sp. JC010]|uniref:hypothetical protein n=1 Tax=Desulfovibrio sp. JC010 TaxID=2593641 RepID=UPI0013D8DE42|nr:hypothetical protein [Desulfovibrio sp. JC010]NDV25057.1 hypothetical protein [Desulfovibrio sp. JC010]